MKDAHDNISLAIFYSSALIFAAISWFLYRFVLSQPTTQTASGAREAAGSGSASNRRNGAPARPMSGVGGVENVASSSTSAHDVKENELVTYGRSRHPPHLVPPPGWNQAIDLSSCVNQGVVPFRSTLALGYEKRRSLEMEKAKKSGDGSVSASSDSGSMDGNGTDLILANRRERARIFARLFSLQRNRANPTSSSTSAVSTSNAPDVSNITPPNRGANVVVTISVTDVSCQKLQKVFCLLGTYYNLFIMLDGSAAISTSEIGKGEDIGKSNKDLISKARMELLNMSDSVPRSESAAGVEYRLTTEIVPLHRIVFSTSNAGRIAFVRQLNGTELVVDGDENVGKELERFGFRVLVYPSSKFDGAVQSCDGSSILGNFLIPS